MKKVILASFILLVLNFMVFLPFSMAQDNDSQMVEMADTMRSEGKIYVVVLVVAIVFTGLIIYAANTDRKLTKVEKELQSLKSSEDS